MNGWGILGGLVGLLLTVGIIGAVLYKSIDLFFRVRPHLRGHFFAAVLWTLVTTCQTASLTLWHQWEPNRVGQGVALLAGSVMVWSWAQFAERQSGATFRQEKRPLLARLFVQSFWGVLAVWAIAFSVSLVVNDFFECAWERRDIAALSRLRAAGFGKDMGYYGYGLRDAVLAQDEQGVRAHLVAGTSCTSYIPNEEYGSSALIYAAVHRNNVAITRMLLDADAPVEPDIPLLHEAVRYGKVEQARLLIHRGADVSEVSPKTHFTALQIAKKNNDTLMIALLKGAGAVK
ncbi:MAG: ankyrin repeat domain-containing protein [Armatimonadetes bacterium]|nr:ankyrin repeat domain-containing protein [Armatimonadota bacterium]